MMKRIVWIIIALVVFGRLFFAWRDMRAVHPAPVAMVASQGENISVISPAAHTRITSPLTVTGEARGTWYFEASFPVELLDANHHEILNADGNAVASVPAQAQGEWMTENFVPFIATLDFTPPATDTGFLVLKKDNPSGLPEHDAQVEIPVRFR